MILREIKYSELLNQPKEWSIDNILLNKINLIVGRNSSGKSRSLNVITGLANFFAGSGILSYLSGNYKVTFIKEENIEIIYELAYEDRIVLNERLTIAGEVVLERDKEGKGKIKYEKLGQYVDFEIQVDTIASVHKRDKLQHPFLEEFYIWASNFRKFYFGSEMGKGALSMKNNFDPNEVNLQDTNIALSAVFNIANKRFPNKFINAVKSDMKAIGYNIDTIAINAIPNIKTNMLDNKIFGLVVKENDLQAAIPQFELSQGMFRSLSLIIHLNFYFLSKLPGCICIDDIGEGLDFERSKSLIDILIGKSLNSKIQLIMSTNDRFVMNNVDLKFWAIIIRKGSKVSFHNYENSQEFFDEFRFTGLNNFDFFATDFIEQGLEEK